MELDYLDSLADDELSVCLRYLSWKPNSNWYKNLRIADRVLVLNKNGPFSRVVGSRLTKVAINDAPLGADWVILFATDVLAERVLQNWGDSVKELFIADDVSFSRVNPEVNLIDAVRMNCTSIRRLALKLDFDRVVTIYPLLIANAGTLEMLRMVFRATESFELNLPDFAQLKSLHVEGPNLQHLTNVLDSCSGTLLSVTLHSGYTNWERVISDLYKCSNLTIVKLKGGVPGEPYATLLESFGSQLEQAEMNEMDLFLCERVMESCPTMECDLTLDENGFERMLVLGSRVRRLLIRYFGNSNDNIIMKLVAERCASITEISCGMRHADGGGQLLNYLFAKEKRNLESIDLLLAGVRFSDDAMNSMLSSEGKLRKLTLNLNLLRDTSEIRQLLAVNRKLEEVKLVKVVEIDQGTGLEIIQTIMRALRRHADLRFLSIFVGMQIEKKFRREIRDECTPFKHRRVEVLVNNASFC